MMSRFFRRIGVTLKKRPLVAREQDRPDVSRHRARWRSLPGPHRSLAPGLHRRDLDQDQHDPPSRLGAARRAAGRQGPARPLEDRDLPRRLAQRPHRRALPVRRPDQRRALPRLRRAVPRPDPQARRHRRPRQSRLPQRQSRAQARSEPPAPAFSSCPNTRPTSTQSSRSSPSSKASCERPTPAPTTRSPTPSPTPSPSSAPTNAPTTSATQDMRQTKCRTL